jgi:sulfur carrier protein ThiS
MIQVGFQVVSIEPGDLRGIGRDGIGEIPVKDGGSLADAMRMVGLDPAEHYMTLINGDPVSPENREGRALKDGDQVVVFPPIEGG